MVKAVDISFSKPLLRAVQDTSALALRLGREPDSLCLLMFLAKDPRVITALVAIGVEPEAMHDATVDALTGSPEATGSMLRCLERAALHVTGAGFQSVHTTDALVALVDNADEFGLEAILAMCPVDVWCLKWHLCHGDMARRSFRQQAHRWASEFASKLPKRSVPGSRESIVIHNDHFTTREFVVDLLEKLFSMTPQQAQTRMLRIHRRGFEVIYTLNGQGEEKMQTAMEMARQRGFPMRLTFLGDSPLRATLPPARVLLRKSDQGEPSLKHETGRTRKIRKGREQKPS